MDATEKQQAFIRSLINQNDRQGNSSEKFTEIKSKVAQPNFWTSLNSTDASTMIEDLLAMKR